MFELIAGLIIGTSITILALHYTKRLKPIQAAETTYTGISAIGVDLAGNNGPQLDPFYRRKLEEVLPGITEKPK
jgi:hypothetical protein